MHIQTYIKNILKIFTDKFLTINITNWLDKIDDNFQYLRLNGHLTTDYFKFSKTNELIVKKMLMNLKNESSAGISNIPVKIISFSLNN